MAAFQVALVHPRDWIDVFQALLTPAVAALAFAVAVAQWWTNRNRLQLELFDRRWAVYVAAMEMISEMTNRATVTQEAQQKYLLGIRGAKWLFDQKVDDYLRKELWKNAAHLSVTSMMLRDDAPAGPSREGAAKRQGEILQWVVGQFEVVDALFDPFLKTDQRFFDWVRSRFRIARSVSRH